MKKINCFGVGASKEAYKKRIEFERIDNAIRIYFEDSAISFTLKESKEIVQILGCLIANSIINDDMEELTKGELFKIMTDEFLCADTAYRGECCRNCVNCNYFSGLKNRITAYSMITNELEELEQYRKIGTVEEFEDLEYKSVAKKPIRKPDADMKYEEVICPCCENYISNYTNKNYCNCGQKIDWE